MSGRFSGIFKLKLLCFRNWIVIAPCGLLGDSNENKPLVGAEEEEVAKMGCPSLGEHTQVEVVIEESYEFKVCLCTNCTSVLAYVHICNQETLQNDSAANQFDVKSCEILKTQQFNSHQASCVKYHLKSKNANLI